jgi:hypothetical protein
MLFDPSSSNVCPTVAAVNQRATFDLRLTALADARTRA